MEHSGFKLIGIVPLEGCDVKFRKNLQIGIPYLFYNNYDIILNNDKSLIEKININKCEVPEELYSLENGIKVNVSAVVGANGSGKSALIELFYYFIYGISALDNSNLNFKKYSNYLSKELESLKVDKEELKCSKNDLKQRISINLQSKYKIQINLKNENSEYITELNEEIEQKIIDYERTLLSTKEIDDLIDQSMNVSVIYEINGEVYNVEYKNGSLSIKNQFGEEVENNLDFEKFFYTISLNYSHHSLNSRILGNWINSLFHKNDGYSTPVVINPMRTDGMYDINRELKLSNERLMFNLAYFLIENQKNKNDYKLLGKYKINGINLSLNEKIYSYPMGYGNKSLGELVSYFLIKDFINENNSTEVSNLDVAVGYLEKKIIKIKENYSTIIFKDFDSTKENEKDYFEKFIIEDNSHITKKLKQVSNFLRYASKCNNSDPILKLKLFESLSLTSIEFVNFIKNNLQASTNAEVNSLSVLELSSYLPPSIFKIDFELSLDDSPNILLSQLSSGEQQMIFNINTILYHLYNLQSSFLSNNTRLAYSNVNIILDEIELYYHPEMQRQFLKNLLDALESVCEKNRITRGIESINICFLTHSPFILSDIPSENVLKLENGEPKSNDNINSFAANIHDLLNDEFFLDKGTIGAYSELKIKELIHFYHKVSMLDFEVNLSKKDADKAILDDEYNNNKQIFDFLVQNVGEPIYRSIIANKLKVIQSKLK